jgi:hypothetical protein
LPYPKDGQSFAIPDERNVLDIFILMIFAIEIQSQHDMLFVKSIQKDFMRMKGRLAFGTK